MTAIHDKSLGPIDDGLFSLPGSKNLAPEQPLGLRLSAAETLARSQLNESQLSSSPAA